MRELKQSVEALGRGYRSLTKKAEQLTSKIKSRTVAREMKVSGSEVTLRLAVIEVNRALNDLTRQTHKLIKAVDKFDIGRVGTRKKTNAKTVAAGPLRTKKIDVKKPPTSPGQLATANDRVLKIIKRSKKGVNLATVIKKTGLEVMTVRNIIQRALKQGKIKRVARGIYIGA